MFSTFEGEFEVFVVCSSGLEPISAAALGRIFRVRGCDKCPFGCFGDKCLVLSFGF